MISSATSLRGRNLGWAGLELVSGLLEGRGGLPLCAVLVGAVAFPVRLFTLLGGAGLYGYGNYDDGVYFAAALALVNGRLPYRDFLLLHPPGIALVLSPFAALASPFGEPHALALARLSWIVLGATSAALVTAILWPRSRFGAVAGGLVYALFYPAVFVERLTLLEAPQTATLLLTLLILTRTLSRVGRQRGWRRPWPWLVAGLLLGLMPDLKIWGVAIVLLIAGWIVVSAGWRRAVQLVVGAAVTGSAAYLPFFLTSPSRMWRYVVLDQLGRRDAGHGLVTRLAGIAGLQRYGAYKPSPTLIIPIIVGGVLIFGLAATVKWARIYLVLLAGSIAVLLSTPTWFQHYPALASGPMALSIGSAAAVLSKHLWRRPWARWVAPAMLLAVLTGYAAPLVTLHLGSAFPGRALAVAARTKGCVTTDDPTNLIELNLLSRNIMRGCPVMIDLGGYTYDLRVGGREVGRRHSLAWQRVAMDYLSSGSTTILSRLATPRYNAFNTASRREIRRWPQLVHVGQTTVRRPRAVLHSS